jgi:hypothetical protein
MALPILDPSSSRSTARTGGSSFPVSPLSSSSMSLAWRRRAEKAGRSGLPPRGRQPVHCCPSPHADITCRAFRLVPRKRRPQCDREPGAPALAARSCAYRVPGADRGVHDHARIRHRPPCHRSRLLTWAISGTPPTSSSSNLGYGVPSSPAQTPTADGGKSTDLRKRGNKPDPLPWTCHVCRLRQLVREVVERIPVGSLPPDPWSVSTRSGSRCGMSGGTATNASAPDTHSTNRVRTRAAVPSRDRYQRHRRRPRHAVDD